MASFVIMVISCPRSVANVPEMLQMSHLCCKCPLRSVANVPGVLQMSPHMLCDKTLDEIERKFNRRLLMVTLFYLGAKLLQEYLKHEKICF